MESLSFVKSITSEADFKAEDLFLERQSNVEDATRAALQTGENWIVSRPTLVGVNSLPILPSI
jgi:hypothetical protein